MDPGTALALGGGWDRPSVVAAGGWLGRGVVTTSNHHASPWSSLRTPPGGFNGLEGWAFRGGIVGGRLALAT